MRDFYIRVALDCKGMFRIIKNIINYDAKL
ncbi:MAG: hypothetical protein PWQ51_2461 [Methanolobus sp.]|jgi:hypothetical protein|nr:hypothetical protein [Methanolobus sp.]